MQTADVVNLLHSLSGDIRTSFEGHRRILSFAQYMELFFAEPQRFARSSAQYLRDCFDHFGSYTVRTPQGDMRRFTLFDGLAPGSPYLVGQEHAQNAIYRLLSSFIREGRVNRLVLLHGPNGSAKSSLIACLSDALERYSHTDGGALYRFNWIFPGDKLKAASIGFGGGSTATSSLPTFAHLADEEVNARLADEMRDIPLLLIPVDERAALLEKAGLTKAGDGSGYSLSEYIGRGDLSAKNKAVFEALLSAYHGDFAEVVKHVQVERFFISRRYRVGVATVGPEMRVDASLRQITSDRSLASLPAALLTVPLYEPFGDLVDGNRGLVEYNDLLKRPMELNRYLLSTSESGTVPLDTCTLHLDTFLVGTVNEAYLDALKGQPDWASYKGRMELVRMPYLRDFHTEAKIYEVQIEQIDIQKPRAPRVCELAALWAVLTRLTRPDPDCFPEGVREVINGLTPIQKARLYADGTVPDGVTGDLARQLTAVVADLFLERASRPDYEGRFGASPREIRTILLNSAHSEEYPCFSPPAMFEELRRLVADPSVFEWLQLKPDGQFHQPAEFVDIVTETYLDIVDNDVRTAMGLIEEAQYEQLFARYVDNVNYWVRKEKMLNPVSGKYEPADESLMKDVETKLGLSGDVESYRNGIISAIGAFRVENPDGEVDYGVIFANQFETLKSNFFAQRVGAIQKIKLNLLRFFDGDTADLSRTEREQVERTMSHLQTELGYTPETAREAVGFLVQHRYDEGE